MNGARCVESTFSKYRCECRSGFTGNHCENKDVCQPNICGSKGICLSIGFTSPISHLCWCSKGQYLGLDCNKVNEPNPCLNADSKNKKVPLALNPSIYVLCDKTRPIIKFCQWGILRVSRIMVMYTTTAMLGHYNFKSCKVAATIVWNNSGLLTQAL